MSVIYTLTNPNAAAGTGRADYEAIMPLQANLSNGTTPGIIPAGSGINAKMLGVGVTLGLYDNIEKLPGAVFEYAYPFPSGYSVNGTPTFGDGKPTSKITFPLDTSAYSRAARASGSLEFNTGRTLEKHIYSQIAT